jgi:bifunctional DNA-binding transcriptional regulator/antitoxin component of YhaV-PrlF toxin-antitoxin module
VVPARLRRKFGIEEGRLVIAEERPEGILIRPALALPVEIYTPQRKAEFLLSNAVDAEDYRAAVAEVKKMGLEPASIPHHKPRKARP